MGDTFAAPRVPLLGSKVPFPARAGDERDRTSRHGPLVRGRRVGQAGPVNRRDSLLAVVMAVVWGVNFPVIDWGMGRVPPLMFAAIRFVVVSLPALWLVPRPDAPWRTVVAVGSTMSVGQIAFLYASLHAGLPPGVAAIVLQAQVVLTIAIAAVVLRERPSPRQVAGVALGAVGLVVVALGRDHDVGIAAVVLCLLAALSWATGNVVVRGTKVPGGLPLTVWSATVVPVPLLLLCALLDGPGAIARGAREFGWHAALSTLYTAGCSTLVGYAILTTLLGRNRPSSVVPWILLVPPVAVLATWGLLGQRPGLAELVGGAVLVTGALVATRAGAPVPETPVVTGGR